ncbi:MAG TPA: NAD(P)H-dependent oxidoreductase [Rhabdochlamydiaceae bacterium]|nr:NAD(P)H-dependent oxidoreductase [Rhabdochlamydiaceae bacterium]
MKKWLLIVSLIFNLSLVAEMKVLAFAGSTREDSYNKKLIREAADIARGLGAQVTVIDLKDYPMPFYDADLEAKQGLPKNAKLLRNLMIASDFIMIASPEYNSSLPPVLKNSLDWASRSDTGPSRDAFKGKRFAIMSASPGGGGGSRALVHLRGVIQDVGGEVIEEQVSVPSAHAAFNEKIKLVNLTQRQNLVTEVQALLKPKL